MPNPDSVQVGRLRAIAHAAAALERDGLRVVDAAYPTADGALDLIAYRPGRHGRRLVVFCQVAANHAPVLPARAAWRRMARQWIDAQPAYQPPLRTRHDAITAELHRDGGLARLQHIRDAG